MHWVIQAETENSSTLKRTRGRSPRSKKISSDFLQNPSVGFAASVSLRLGHAPALNVHRTFIHYRRAASLPSRGSLEKFLLHFKIYREHCANQYSSEVVIKLFTVHFADWVLYFCAVPSKKCGVGISPTVFHSILNPRLR